MSCRKSFRAPVCPGLDRVMLVCALLMSLVFTEASVAQSSRVRVTKAPDINATREKMEDVFADKDSSKLSSDRLKLSGRFAMYGASYQAENSDSAGFGARFSTKAKYRLLESLSADAEIALSLLSDRTQEVVGDNYSDSGIRLRHASLDWTPVPAVLLQVGALKQGKAVNSKLLISESRNFPATLQQIGWGGKYGSIAVVAQQAIPTSRSLDSERQEKEKLPSFFTEKLVFNIAPNDHLQFMPYYGVFRFKDLPSKVAFEGSTRGNSVRECFAANCEFAFGFEGQVYGGEALLRFNDDFEVVGFYNEVRNDQAPEKFNTGREVGVMSSLRIKNLILTPAFASFFSESDVSPSYYSSADYGGSNVEGYRAALGLSFVKYKFRFDVEYTDSKVVNPGRNQKDRAFIAFGLETFNVEF